MKQIVLLLLLLILLTASGCKATLARLMGLKKPKPTTNEQVIQYVTSHKLDHDYLIRPNSDTDIVFVNHYLNIGFNSIVLYDSAGNEIANTNDSTCHMNLRSQITYLLQHEGYTPSTFSKNAKSKMDARTACLNCTNAKPVFEQNRKQFVLIFSIARFIPLKQPFSDIDYLQELKDKKLRDKLTVILIDEDLHP